jgi:hemolysin activation/secretion protein
VERGPHYKLSAPSVAGCFVVRECDLCSNLRAARWPESRGETLALHGAAGRWLQGACLAAAATLGLTAIPAGAAGLGQLVVQSHLGEPLRAHIEIVGLQPGEEAKVRIAPRAVHTRAGIAYSALLGDWRVMLERRDGMAVASISGTQPVDLPAIDFIVELTSASGSLMRQYALLPSPAPRAAGRAPLSPGPLSPPPPAPVVVEVPAKAAEAPRPQEDSPRFTIARYLFDGATLVLPERLQAATAPYTGPGRSFGDVQRALEAIEREYSATGYSAVQVLLPEQELERGEVRFRILEAKLGRVLVEGNRHFDQANIRASVPALVPGEAPNILAVGRNLRVANENPAKQATVLLRSGREEGTVDAAVRVVDGPAERTSVTLDTSGTRETGRLRLGLGYQDANTGNNDHVLTLQYVGAPHDKNHPSRLSLIPSSRVFVFGASLRIPLYEQGDAVDVTAGYSNVDSGTVGELFNISGAGGIFGLRYTHYLDRSGDYDHRLALAWDHRGYHFKGIRAVGSNQQLQPDVAVRPLSLTYQGRWAQPDGETSFSLGGSRNLPGGNDGRAEDFCQLGPNPPHGFSRSDGMGNCPDHNYVLWRWSVNHLSALPGNWQLRAGVNGQYTRDMLVAGEQFGLGGADSVRGFEERALSDDRGWRGTVEFYTPDFGGSTGIAGGRARGLAFYDFGALRRIRPAAGDPPTQSISSAGFGLRFTRGSNLSFRMDWGWVIDGGGTPGLNGDPGTFRERGDGRLHASLSYVF